LQSASNLLGIFQQLDFMMLQGITAASVQAGAHSMCNGATLAYETQAFEKAGGFSGIDKLASGDDMLLLHKIWRLYPDRVHYLKNPLAIMPTPAMPYWGAFFRQRIRWSSKATYYQDWRISTVLFFVYGFNVWLLLLLAAAVANQVHWLSVGLYLVVKTVAELLLLWPAAHFFRSTRLLPFFPLLQPLHVLYTVAVGLASRRGGYEWKGRQTK
jgi:cellulose synthase/poly-beta-1,6-N-acetylglucosamine synthase-like glycosyltransferase